MAPWPQIQSATSSHLSLKSWCVDFECRMALDMHRVVMTLKPPSLLWAEQEKQEPSMVVKSKGLLSQTDGGLNIGSPTTLDSCLLLSFTCEMWLCQASIRRGAGPSERSLAGSWMSESRWWERREEVWEAPGNCSPAVDAQTSSLLCSSHWSIFCGVPSTHSPECKSQARQETSKELSERAGISPIRKKVKL